MHSRARVRLQGGTVCVCVGSQAQGGCACAARVLDGAARTSDTSQQDGTSCQHAQRLRGAVGYRFDRVGQLPRLYSLHNGQERAIRHAGVRQLRHGRRLRSLASFKYPRKGAEVKII